MKYLLSLFLIGLLFTSCDEKKEIIGKIEFNEEQLLLSITLENKSENNHYFAYKYLSGCPLKMNNNGQATENCLVFDLLSVKGYKNKELQNKLFNNIEKSYKNNGFGNENPTLINNLGIEKYLNINFFLLPKKSSVTYLYSINNYKKGISYTIKFNNIQFSELGTTSSKRKLVQEEFYDYGEIDNFKPFRRNILIDSLIIN